MAKAIDELVKIHNTVIVFSAGNNGPGLGSLNRSSIYPSSVLRVGAYASKGSTLVHGVSGLPDEVELSITPAESGASFGAGNRYRAHRKSRTL